ncbi:phage distal tail protein [Kitasatospora sp. P5_F3]
MAGELVTGPGLIQWGSTLLGRFQDGGVTTSYRWRRITGWEETPTQDSGTTLRAQQHGAYPGRLLAQTRIITVEDVMVRVPPGQIGTAIATLAAATPIGQDDEQPLVIQLDERGPLLVWARVLRRALPVDPRWQLGHSAGGAIQWEASDPRRYSVAESSTSAVLPTAETGLSFGSPSETGLSFGSPTEVGLSFGTAGATGDLLVTNAGNTATHPVIELRGPVTTPTVTLGALRLEYAITLGAADTLIIDTSAGTVLLGGQSRIHTATSRSVPEGAFVLPPGQSVVSFRADPGSTDPAAQATIRWRSAYM